MIVAEAGGSLCADAQAEIKNGEAHVIINWSKFNDPWRVQLCILPIILENGKTYRLKFDANCDNNYKIKVGIHKIEKNWKRVTERSFDIDSEKRTYSLIFKMVDSAQDNYRLEFNLNGNKGNFWLSNVHVEESME